MNSGRPACAPRAFAHAPLLALAAGLTLTTPSFALGTECVDVRTGRTFTASTARYSSSGSISTEETPLGRLCVGVLRATHAVPIRDGADGAFVVWIESAGEDCDLKVQHVGGDGLPLGGWSEGGRVVCAARGTQTQPTVALSSDGGVWVAWKDFRDPRRSGIFLTRLDAEGAPSTGFPVDGLRIGATTTAGSDPALVRDQTGGAWLVWQSGLSGQRELRMVHMDEAGTISAGWPSEGKLVVEADQHPVRPLAVSDADGGVMLSWVSEMGELGHLRLARLDALGQPRVGWPGGGLEVATSSVRIRTAALVADTSGSFVAWNEAGDDSTRALITHVTTAGACQPDWPTGGKVIGEGQFASSPTLALDGTGGVYLAWIGHASDAAPGDVRLVRLDGSGVAVAGWPAEGTPVTQTALDEQRPRVLTLADGVLTSWAHDETGGRGAVLSAALESLGALPVLKGVEKWPDLVRLSWQGAASARYAVLVERSGEDGEWDLIRELSRNSKGDLVLEDPEVKPGEVLTYRLRLRTTELDVVTGEVQVEVPAVTPLAIRGLAVEGGVLHLAYSLPSRAETRFELFDVQGRRLLRDVRQHEHAGELTLQWPRPAGVRAGVFFARLTQAGESRTRRFVLAGR